MTPRQISDLVSGGKLAQALQEAKNLVQQRNDAENTSAIALLQASQAQLERDTSLNMISFDDANRTRARISYGLLDILSKLTPAANSTILFLASNPKNTAKLQLEQECAKISEEMQDFPSFSVKSRFAVTPDLVINALTDYKPGMIHFSGHGQGTGYGDGMRASGVPAAAQNPAEGIVLQNDVGDIQIATGEQLRRLFEAFNAASPINLVFLNACHSAAQAQIIHSTVPYVIGMSAAVPDNLAIAFAARFYRTLGSGNTIPNAFNISKAAMNFEGLSGDSIPVLYQPA